MGADSSGLPCVLRTRPRGRAGRRYWGSGLVGMGVQAAGWRRRRRGLEEEEERVETMGQGRRMGRRRCRSPLLHVASSCAGIAEIAAAACGPWGSRGEDCSGGERVMAEERFFFYLHDGVTVCGVVDGSSYNIEVCLAVGLIGTDGSDHPDLTVSTFLY
jgi:hypothetical protein